MITFIKQEPVRFASIVVATLIAIIGALRAFGVGVSEAQEGAIVELARTAAEMAIVLVGGQAVRSRVSPVPVLLLALALPVQGCSGTFEGNRPPRVTIGVDQEQRCQDLDDRYQRAGGVAKGAAVLAGGSGLAGIAVDDDNARLGLAIGSAAMGATAAAAGFIADGASSSWARECAGP